MNEKVIETRDLTRVFTVGEEEIRAIDGVSMAVSKGDFIAITGPSGSGKTSLLNVIGCLDRPTSGQLLLEGEDVAKMSGRQLDDLRLEKIGFVFQTFNLFPTLSALENVMFPMGIAGVPRTMQKKRATELLGMVGLSHRLNHRPKQLSAGENQRVGIARGLANSPLLLLCDEPTGNLDSKTKREIASLFKRINEEYATTILLVTHDPGVAEVAPRQLRMMDGKFV
jgi:putative ABC transport system ATP-binding protein